MSSKLISIIIPTYKRSEKLGRAIKSVVNQTYTNIEVLVVSDNEPDDEYTASARVLVDSFHDSRVKLVTQEHHKNGAAARNAGIKASTGVLIAFLDDDDFWDKEKLQKQYELLETLDPSYGGVSCLNRIFKGGVLSHLQLGYRSGLLYKRILLKMMDVSTDTVLLRRDALFETGLYDESLLRHQEIQLFTFFTSKYKIKLLNEYLCNVDIDDNQNRPNPEKLKNIKIAFLKSVEPILNQLSPLMKFSIRLVNQFELGGIYIKNHEYWNGIINCASVLLSPIATYSAVRRLVRRMKSRTLPKEFRGKTIDYYLSINGLNKE